MLVTALGLFGCGGGGGGGSKGTSPAPAPATPTATVTLTPKGAIEKAVATGESFTATLEVAVTASNLAAGDRIFLRIRDTTATFGVPAPQPVQAEQTFRYALNPRTTLSPGNYRGQLEITPCRDGGCAAAYGAPVRVDYRVDVSSLGEWSTLQRDATHAGYVPTEFDPTTLSLAWEWRPPHDATAAGEFLVRPATGGGKVFVLGGSYLSNGTQRGVTLHALSEYNGARAWSYAIPGSPRSLAPTTDAGVVILPSINNDTLLTALEQDSGAIRYTYAQTTVLGAQILPPSSIGGRTYFFAGTTGDELHAMDSTTGQRVWSQPRTGLKYASPTVNAEHVYYQTPTSLDVLDYRTGALVASIPDPAATGAESAGLTLVVLGSRGNALVNSYDRVTTRMPLTSFDIIGRRWQWTTQHAYFSLFAVADGVVYAHRNVAPPTLDAIDETTGQVLWSWTPPASDAQTEGVGNILVTRNMVFLSTVGNTTSWVWAIDRATHQVVWRYPGGGNLAMSGSRTLLVQTGPVGGDSYDTIRAFRLP